jgi:hypothetical protein
MLAGGIRCWLFAEDATWGERVWSEIDKSIRVHDKVVVICSKNSLRSEPVLREIERALQREDQERRNVLYPVRIASRRRPAFSSHLFTPTIDCNGI